MLRVCDVMTHRVVSVGTDATLGNTLTYLATQHISGAAVVDRKERLVGAITWSDIMEAEAEMGDPDARGRLLEKTLVREVMTQPVLTIGPDAELREAAQVMVHGDVHRLFVEEAGQLVGVISRRDVNHAFVMGAV
jgi:CBS-domain-containing membrane protein